MSFPRTRESREWDLYGRIKQNHRWVRRYPFLSPAQPFVSPSLRQAQGSVLKNRFCYLSGIVPRLCVSLYISLPRYEERGYRKGFFTALNFPPARSPGLPLRFFFGFVFLRCGERGYRSGITPRHWLLPLRSPGLPQRINETVVIIFVTAHAAPGSGPAGGANRLPSEATDAEGGTLGRS